MGVCARLHFEVKPMKLLLLVCRAIDTDAGKDDAVDLMASLID